MAAPPWENRPFRLRVYFNFLRFGWSEVYWLTAFTAENALADARDLINRRRLWLGIGPRVEYAAVCRGTPCVDTWAVDVSDIFAFPPLPLPQPRLPNDTWSGWEYRVEAPDGRFTTRLFKCVPDNWVRNQKAAGPVAVLKPLGTAGLPAIQLVSRGPGQLAQLVLGPGQTLALLQRSFLDALLVYTGFTLPSRQPAVQATSVMPLGRVLYRQVGMRQSGHNYRRVSVESLAVGWLHGLADPPFSFCGQCVGVTRTTYQAACRWSVGGPVSRMRFYYIPRTNPVFYGRLRFGPKNSEPGYRNLAGVGEITRQPRVYYVGTNVFPARDGTHPDVTPRQAAGLDLWPAAWADGMPAAFLPACDYPLGPFQGMAGRLGLRGGVRPYVQTFARLQLSLGLHSGLQGLGRLAAALNVLLGLKAGTTSPATATAALEVLLGLATGTSSPATAAVALNMLLGVRSGLVEASAQAAALNVLLGLQTGTTSPVTATAALEVLLGLVAGTSSPATAAAALGVILGVLLGLAEASAQAAALNVLLGLQSSTSSPASATAALEVLLSLVAGTSSPATAAVALQVLLGLKAGTSSPATAAVALQVLLGLKAGTSSPAMAAGLLQVLCGLEASSSSPATAAGALRVLLQQLTGTTQSTQGSGSFIMSAGQQMQPSLLSEVEAELLFTLAIKAGVETLTESEGTLLLLLAQKAGLSLPSNATGASPGKPGNKVSISMSFATFGLITPAGGCGSLPSVDVVRFSGGTGGATDLNGVAMTVTWNAGAQNWQGTTGSGATLSTWFFACTSGVWKLGVLGYHTTPAGAVMTGTSGATPSLTGSMTISAPSAGTVNATFTRT